MKDKPRANWFWITAVCLAVLLAAACGGGGGGDSSSSSSTDSSYQYLYDHNAYALGGYTIRWPTASVSVGTSIGGTDGAFNTWVSAAAGNLVLSYGSSGGSITVYYDNSLGALYCGETTTYYNSAGQIIQATVRINPSQSDCAQGLWGTLVHEGAHALGFFGHDSGDSIMNTTGSGPVTTQNQTFFQMLYSMAAGTNINGYLSAVTSAQSSLYDAGGGRIYSITQRTTKCAP